MKTKLLTLLLLYTAMILFGLVPDILVKISAANSIAGHDVILEKAIQHLSGQ